MNILVMNNTNVVAYAGTVISQNAKDNTVNFGDVIFSLVGVTLFSVTILPTDYSENKYCYTLTNGFTLNSNYVTPVSPVTPEAPVDPLVAMQVQLDVTQEQLTGALVNITTLNDTINQLTDYIFTYDSGLQ